MTRKTGLGRGLDALIPSGDFTPEPLEERAGEINQVPIDQITRNPRQPRSHIDPQELAELALSIKENGILQPLVVARNPEAGGYTLIVGERRLLAARQAGLTSVPVILRTADDQKKLELALVENVQRVDLNPLDAAEAYRQLTDDFGLSHDEIANQVGKSRVSITNTIRLLKLPTSVKKALTEGLISEGHARAMLALPTAQAQDAILLTIIKRELNVRQTEEVVRKLVGEKLVKPQKREVPPEYRHLEEQLRTRLGTKISLNPHGRGGTLVIYYYSQEELDALVDKILGSGY